MGPSSSGNPTKRTHDGLPKNRAGASVNVIVSTFFATRKGRRRMAQSGAQSPTVFVIDDDDDVRASIAGPTIFISGYDD